MYLLLCLAVIVVPVFNLPVTDQKGHCRCVPNQWEGILSSTDREFDLKGGQAANSENNLQVHYDFKNKKFAMTDLRTKSKAIADYGKGYKYVIRGNVCQGIRTAETMREMCLPESAEFLGEFTLGTTVPVDLWEFSGPYNTTMKTAVLHEDCIPVSEEVYMSRGGYVSVTSSVYLNVDIGVGDPDVFTPPSDCVLQVDDPRMSQGYPQKRSGTTTEEMLRALQRRMFMLA